MMRLLTALLIGSVMTIALSAQGNGKFRERVKTLKKVKMIEYLDLEESKADQLMTKFTSLEGQMEDATEKLRDATKTLEEAVDNDISGSRLRDLSMDVKQKTENLLNLQITKLEEIDKILDDDEFARFLVFEKNFRDELKERIAKGARERRGRD
jgi:hypothetical protein